LPVCVRSHPAPGHPVSLRAVTRLGENCGMARTHGTRSAYNAGCRCDACREARRVARARQREVQAWAPTDSVPGRPDRGVAPATAPGVGLALAGLGALGVGGYAVWHGATLPRDEDTDTDARRRAMVRWILVGVAVLGVGALAVRHAAS
jgi:hypothetical protein